MLDPQSVALVFVTTFAICLAANSLGVRLALKVDPAAALAAAG
jgi:putative ABC transport system permease protein